MRLHVVVAGDHESSVVALAAAEAASEETDDAPNFERFMVGIEDNSHGFEVGMLHSLSHCSHGRLSAHWGQSLRLVENEMARDGSCVKV